MGYQPYKHRYFGPYIWIPYFPPIYEMRLLLISSGERIHFLNRVCARGFITPSEDSRSMFYMNPSLLNVMPNRIQMIKVKVMSPYTRNFPLSKWRRGVISPNIFHECIMISLWKNLDVFLSKYVAEARDFLQSIMPKESISSISYFPKALLLNKHSLGVGHFPNWGS